MQTIRNATHVLLGCRTAVYTCVLSSSSTLGGNLRCFSSTSPVFGLLCRRIRCTYADEQKLKTFTYLV